VEKRISRVKVRKLMGQDTDSLVDKPEAAHSSKAKQGTQARLPTVRQVFSHLQGSRAPSRILGRQTPSP